MCLMPGWMADGTARYGERGKIFSAASDSAQDCYKYLGLMSTRTRMCQGRRESLVMRVRVRAVSSRQHLIDLKSYDRIGVSQRFSETKYPLAEKRGVL